MPALSTAAFLVYFSFLQLFFSPRRNIITWPEAVNCQNDLYIWAKGHSSINQWRLFLRTNKRSVKMGFHNHLDDKLALNRLKFTHAYDVIVLAHRPLSYLKKAERPPHDNTVPLLLQLLLPKIYSLQPRRQEPRLTAKIGPSGPYWSLQDL